jgi:hypothetical protein
MSDRRYTARPASDKTDDWTFWFVADNHKGGLNVTAPLRRKLCGADPKSGAVFLRDWDAVKLAMNANRATTATDGET